MWLWVSNGMGVMPTQDDVGRYDPRYVSDMRVLQQIYSHQKNDSVVMQLYEQHTAAQHRFKSKEEVEKQNT